MRKFIILFFVSLLTIGCTMSENHMSKTEIEKFAQSTGEFPKQLDYVSDFDNTMTDTEVRYLNKMLSDYDKRTTNQIAIVSISENLNDTNFDQFALDLSRDWGVGTAEKNNGLTIVYSVKLGRIRINTGLGTEKILTDEICEQVLKKTILPEFSKGNHYAGLKKAVIQFIKLWH